MSSINIKKCKFCTFSHESPSYDGSHVGNSAVGGSRAMSTGAQGPPPGGGSAGGSPQHRRTGAASPAAYAGKYP